MHFDGGGPFISELDRLFRRHISDAVRHAEDGAWVEVKAAASQALILDPKGVEARQWLEVAERGIEATPEGPTDAESQKQSAVFKRLLDQARQARSTIEEIRSLAGWAYGALLVASPFLAAGAAASAVFLEQVVLNEDRLTDNSPVRLATLGAAFVVLVVVVAVAERASSGLDVDGRIVLDVVSTSIVVPFVTVIAVQGWIVRDPLVLGVTILVGAIAVVHFRDWLTWVRRRGEYHELEAATASVARDYERFVLTVTEARQAVATSDRAGAETLVGDAEALIASLHGQRGRIEEMRKLLES